MQNAAFRAAGVDGVYRAVACDADAFPAIMRRLARAGGGNVTVPHKELAASLLDRAAHAVARTGACNTFWGEDDALAGDNTDVAGFAAAVRALVGPPRDARVLLAGAGGAARAAVVSMMDEGADAIVVWNRSRERAEALRAALDPEGTRVRVVADPEAGGSYDLLVNATPLGLRSDDPLPIPPSLFRRGTALLDMTYAAGGTTRLVRAAADAGLHAADGLEMLLHQGAAAFQRWWGREAPLDAMRQALTAAR
jgi:shikimate dehydrogenase